MEQRILIKNISKIQDFKQTFTIDKEILGFL